MDFTTRGMYLGYVERTIRPALGEYEVGYLESTWSFLTGCTPSWDAAGGGRRGLVDHRPAGRGKRREDGTPDHDCDQRCRPHQCRPAEPATIVQIHNIIKGTLGYAVRWKWIGENPR